MEQSDFEEFRYHEADTDSGTPGSLVCAYCKGKVVKNYNNMFGIVPSLLDLIKDAAAHFAAVHRKTDEAI